MRTIAILAMGMMTALIAGCLLESRETKGEPAVDEAPEAASSFSSPFKFHKHYAGTSKIIVPAHGAVAVAAHATWDRPAACKLPTFTIELVKAGLFGSEGSRTYATTGATTTQTWTNLGVGTYHLVFDTANDDIKCVLEGAVTVSVTP
jgi:hypothetical protein